MNILSYSDEIIFFLSLIVIVSFFLIRPSAYKLAKFPWDRFVVLFILFSFVSIFANRVPFGQGLFGTYDVLKNILVVYLFSSLRYTREEFFNILKSLSALAFFLAGVGILGEILALFFGWGIGTLVFEVKRLGLFRIISLVGRGNWNYFGIYLVFFLLIGTVVARNKVSKTFFSFTTLTAIILTFSRQAWVGLGIILISMKKKLIPIAALFLVFIIVTFLTDSVSYSPDLYYRSFTLKESAKLFSQKPLLGVGPGMFGGLASVLLQSPYYEDWPEFFRSFIITTRNIDMFWPWILTEFGSVGFLLYIAIWLALFIRLGQVSRSFRARQEHRLASLGRVLRSFILALAAMGLAGGLNAAFVAFTYFALTGIYLSVHRHCQNEDSAHQ